MNEVIRFHC